MDKVRLSTDKCQNCEYLIKKEHKSRNKRQNIALLCKLNLPNLLMNYCPNYKIRIKQSNKFNIKFGGNTTMPIKRKVPEVSDEVKEKIAAIEKIRTFSGIVESIDREASQLPEGNDQYHIKMRPIEPKELIDLVKDSTTGCLHEWIGISKSTTETEIAEGSLLDNYITEAVFQIPELDKYNTHGEFMNGLIKRVYVFTKKRIGKAFKGYPAKEVFIPTKDITNSFIKEKKK